MPNDAKSTTTNSNNNANNWNNNGNDGIVVAGGGEIEKKLSEKINKLALNQGQQNKHIVGEIIMIMLKIEAYYLIIWVQKS